MTPINSPVSRAAAQRAGRQAQRHPTMLLKIQTQVNRENSVTSDSLYLFDFWPVVSTELAPYLSIHVQPQV